MNQEMNFVHNIAIYNHSIEEIRLALVNVMASWNFQLASSEIVEQTSRSLQNLIPTIDSRLMLRKFLISPSKNKWSVIYQTLWFSEAQDLGIQLSKELDGIVLVFLMDDSYGWGYELSKGGELLDKFHTNPTSETLHEKEAELGSGESLEEDTSEVNPVDKDILELLEEKSQIIEKLPDPTFLDRLNELGKPTAEQIAEYQGNPSILADLLGLPEEKVAERLVRSQDGFSIHAHDEMQRLLEKDLGIENWYKDYQEFMGDLENLKDWQHLTFARRMTPVELQWCKKEKNQDFIPHIAPPVWLNQ